MSVRKFKLAPGIREDYTDEHIIAQADRAPLLERDLKSLHRYRDQHILTLCRVHADSLDFLEEWHDLRSLRMYGCQIPDCTALARLKHFEHLWYNTNRVKDPDLSFLSGLKHLEILGIGYITHLKLLPDLSKCKRMKRISIFTCNQLKDISTVLTLPNLQSFSYSGRKLKPSDLEPIMKMKSIKKMSAGFGSQKSSDEFNQLLERYGLEFGA